jgi:hypothetical protein
MTSTTWHRFVRRWPINTSRKWVRGKRISPFLHRQRRDKFLQSPSQGHPWFFLYPFTAVSGNSRRGAGRPFQADAACWHSASGCETITFSGGPRMAQLARFCAAAKTTLILLWCLVGCAALGAVAWPLIATFGSGLAYFLRSPDARGFTLDEYLEWGYAVGGRYFWIGAMIGAVYPIRIILGAAIAEYRKHAKGVAEPRRNRELGSDHQSS